MIALLEAHRAGLYARHHWLPNIVAGVIVGVVALPLAMAFAIASGARPEQGLYTAIIGGFMGKEVLDKSAVSALATLPSLDQLRAKIIGLLQAPATKIAGVLQAPGAQVARVIGAYAAKDAA